MAETAAIYGPLALFILLVWLCPIWIAMAFAYLPPADRRHKLVYVVVSTVAAFLLCEFLSYATFWFLEVIAPKLLSDIAHQLLQWRDSLNDVPHPLLLGLIWVADWIAHWWWMLWGLLLLPLCAITVCYFLKKYWLKRPPIAR